ncbi:hypothetical protein OAL13_00225 [bacterium]|nr:hypothetical protein [bacterium]
MTTTTINSVETDLTLRFDAQLNFIEAENNNDFNEPVISSDLVQRALNTISQFRHLIPDYVNQRSERFFFSVRSDEKGLWSVEAIGCCELYGPGFIKELYEGPLLAN